MRSRLLACALLTFNLSACTSLERQPAATVAEDELRLSGRLSVQVSDTNTRPTGGNVGFELSGKPSAGQLELSTPLGSLVARAKWVAGDVNLQTPEGRRSYANLDDLSRELLGQPIPVAALFDWLQGRPWPQAASLPLENGLPGFMQLAWRIDTASFDTAARQGLIIATRNTPGEPLITLRARIEP